MIIRKDVEKLIGINIQLGFINIYRAFHWTAAEYIYIACAQASFIKMYCMLDYEICTHTHTHVQELKSCSLFSDYSNSVETQSQKTS